MPMGASAVIRGRGVGTGSRLGARPAAGHAIGSVNPVTSPVAGYRRAVLRRSRLSASLLSVLASTSIVLAGAPACAVVPAGDTPATGAATTSRAPATSPATPATRSSADDAIDSVLAISLDGLNPDALRRLGAARTPHLHELIATGASTLNARTERERTLTLPNHTGMVTGRRIGARQGGHGVTWNDDRRRPRTVQAAAGRPVSSVFTSVHEAGGSAAVFASKTKFSLWQRSWPAAIDKMVIQLDNLRLTRAAARDLRRNDRELRFVHLSLPDAVGHARGFMSRPYLRAVRQVDGMVGELVATIEADPDLAASTAVIVTSDHGGRGEGHHDRRSPDNYRVPFIVAGPGVAAGADLYDLNADDYRDPGNRRTTYGAARQPVRNGDVANLALDLLDLGAVPGSEHNRSLDLDVSLPE